MEAQHVYVNSEPRTTSTFARGVSYIAASVSFTLANFTFVRTEKLRQWKSALDLCTKKAWVHGRERTQLEDAILDLLS